MSDIQELTRIIRVFIIHGWGGYPEEGFFPWLKTELEKKGIQVYVPAMPDTDNPRIETWVPFLTQQVGTVDEDTFFVGHSIGCQAILRYLQTINSPIGGVVLVAGWLNRLTGDLTPDEVEIAKPWIGTTIDIDKVRKNAKKFVAIFSDKDPFVDLENKKLMEERLGAKTFIVSGWEHFSGSEGIKELPIVLDQLEKMMK